MSTLKTRFQAMLLVIGLNLAAQFVLPSSAFAAATSWVGDANAAARLITAVQATGSAGQIEAALQIRLAPGWHAYWRSPGDAGIPPSIDWSGSKNLQSGKLYWPAPKRFLLDGLVTQGYETGVVLPIAVTLVQPGKPIFLHALVHYSACKDICIPYTASLHLSLPAGLAISSAEAALISQAWTTIPGSLTDAGLSLSSVIVSSAAGKPAGAILSVSLSSQKAILSLPDIFIENLSGPTPAAPTVQTDPANHRAILSVFLTRQEVAAAIARPLRFTFEASSLSAQFVATPVLGQMPHIENSSFNPVIVLIALLGGLILNIMPCVLPVLSLKLFSLAGAREEARSQYRLNLLATAAGVMASFIIIALVLIVLKTAGAAIGWGIQFQQPWFLGAMALVTTLFAASLWEWLPIPMPGFAGRIASRSGKTHNPSVAAFITGALASVLAVSCTAPFIGTAVGFALARGPLTIVGIFTALGFGMAMPYLAIAAMPGLVGWLPKPGVWMNKLRIILGFMLLATAAWLLSIIVAVVSARAAFITGAVLSTILLLLFMRHQRRADGLLLRRTMTGLTAGLAVIAVILPSLMPQTIIGSPRPGASLATVFQSFDQSRINGLLAQNKLVFVDVTAAWCLVCKVNALTVLDRDPVAVQLRAANVVAMRADWTRPSPVITTYLESFHRYGVPLDAVYGPGAPSGILLPSLLTPGVVMDAFRRAGTAINSTSQTEASQ